MALEQWGSLFLDVVSLPSELQECKILFKKCLAFLSFPILNLNRRYQTQYRLEYIFLNCCCCQ
jgi:hypothetical protein